MVWLTTKNGQIWPKRVNVRPPCTPQKFHWWNLRFGLWIYDGEDQLIWAGKLSITKTIILKHPNDHVTILRRPCWKMAYCVHQGAYGSIWISYLCSSLQYLSFDVHHIYIGHDFLKSYFSPGGWSGFSKGGAISQNAQGSETCTLSYLFKLPLNYKNQS